MSTDVTVKRLINGREGRGVNRYMLEEVYFSEACENTESGKMYNPQNARYEPSTGRWYFNFPDMWYNNLSTSKAIGLRKIDVIAKPLFLEFDLTMYRIDDIVGSSVIPETYHMVVQVPINESTDDVCCRMTNVCTSTLRSDLQNLGNVADLTFTWTYDHKDQKLTAKFYPGLELEATYAWGFGLFNMNQDMQDFLNWESSDRFGEEPKAAEYGTMEFTFTTVWNRQTIFFHASFVTGTSFNYLGRSGEFYPKPSKMYPASHSSQQFYFEVSFDGMHPVKFMNFLFFIDLAYIYYDKNYNGD